MRVVGLIIAIEEYPKAPSLHPIPGVNEAAAEFRQWLISHKGAAPDDILVCADPEAVPTGRGTTYADIRNAAFDLMDAAQDRTHELFIFMAGHGFSYRNQPHADRLDLLVTGEWVDPERSGDACLPVEELLTRLRLAIGPATQFIFFDACRTEFRPEDVDPRQRLGFVLSRSSLGQKAQYSLYSVARGAPASVSDTFSHTLLVGLRGEKDAKIWSEEIEPPGWWVTFDQLHSFAYKRCPQVKSNVVEGAPDPPIVRVPSPPKVPVELEVSGAGSETAFTAHFQDTKSARNFTRDFNGPQASLLVELPAGEWRIQLAEAEPSRARVIPAKAYWSPARPDEELVFAYQFTQPDEDLDAQDDGTGKIRGKVKWFDEEKGYGFIARYDGDEDVFMHFSALRQTGVQTIAEDAQVEFELEMGPKGPEASDVVQLPGSTRPRHSRSASLPSVEVEKVADSPSSGDPAEGPTPEETGDETFAEPRDHSEFARDARVARGINEMLYLADEFNRWSGLIRPAPGRLIAFGAAMSALDNSGRFTCFDFPSPQIGKGNGGLVVLRVTDDPEAVSSAAMARMDSEGLLASELTLELRADGRSSCQVGSADLAPGVVLLTISPQDGPDVRLPVLLEPNRLTLVTLEYADDLNIWQITLPRSSSESFSCDAALRVFTILKAQENFAAVQPPYHEFTSREMQVWDDLISGEPSEPIATLLAAYDVFRGGEPEDIARRPVQRSRFIRSMLAHIGTAPDRYALRLALGSDVENIGLPTTPPLLLEGALALEAHGYELPSFDGMRIDFGSLWTRWIG